MEGGVQTLTRQRLPLLDSIPLLDVWEMGKVELWMWSRVLGAVLIVVAEFVCDFDVNSAPDSPPHSVPHVLERLYSTSIRLLFKRFLCLSLLFYLMI